MMAIKRLMTMVGVSVALTAFPLALSAATANQCVCGKPTAASYTWDFHREADNLFEDVHADAHQIRDHAARLQSFEDDAGVTWQLHADQLIQLKSEINDMGQKLCRLETIRRVVAPWQKETIDRIASTAQLLADNTQDAIVYVNAHQEHLLNPMYRRYADNLYSEASELTRSTGDAVEYVKVRGEYQELRSEIGIGGNPS